MVRQVMLIKQTTCICFLGMMIFLSFLGSLYFLFSSDVIFCETQDWFRSTSLRCSAYFGWHASSSSWVVSLLDTPSVPNYRSFDFFNLKFDHSSYSKICTKYQFFCCRLLYQYKIFKNDLIWQCLHNFFQ